MDFWTNFHLIYPSANMSPPATLYYAWLSSGSCLPTHLDGNIILQYCWKLCNHWCTYEGHVGSWQLQLRFLFFVFLFFFFFWLLLIICIYIGSILQEITNTVFDEDNKLSSLMSMGYTRDEASIAMERCGVYFSVMHILKWFSFFLIFVLIMSYLVKM